MTLVASTATYRRRLWHELITHGLCPGPEQLERGLVTLAGCGRSLLSRELGPRLGARLPGLYGDAAPVAVRAAHGRVAAFSYLYCDGMQRSLGHEPAVEANVAAALLSIAICGADRVIDGGLASPCVLHELAALGDTGRLATLLPSARDAGLGKLDHHELAPQLVPCFATLDEFFAELTRLLRRAADTDYAAELRSEMIALISEAAAAELATRDLQFSQHPSDTGISVLRAANTLPQWIVASIALAPHPRPSPAIHTQLTELTELFAEMMWVLDDLADAPEDLLAGRWSRAWLALVDADPAATSLLERRDPEALLRLAGSSVVDREIGRIEQLLNQTRGYAALAETGLRDLRGLARMSIWSWMAPEVISYGSAEAPSV